jgi:hypothetical protein
LISVPTVATSAAVNDGWKKVGEEEGIVGYSRSTTKSKVDEIKAIGVVDAPVAVVEAVIRDISSMPEYIFLCKEAFPINTAEMKSDGDVIYFYSLTDLPFPVWDRDAVARSVWTIDQKTGTIYCHTDGVKTSYQSRKGVIRMPYLMVDCTLIPRGAGQTEVIYQVLGDPGGDLPSFVVNMLIKDYGIKSVAGLRKMVKKDKYKNAKAVVTKTTR